jgi:dolichol-phosphate mannosyltransferase
MTNGLSIVAPCYNEEEVLPEFVRRSLKSAADTGMDYELILVDDGSSDGTWRVISECVSYDQHVRGVRLLRNHGHQLALSAGLSVARGNLVLAIDADLQDQPELIVPMIALMSKENASVVYGKRKTRAGETAFKLWSAKVFYRFLSWMSNVDIPQDTGDFRLMTREVVDILNAMPERHRFIRGMVAWIGGNQVPFLYDRDSRFAGTTKYPYRRLLWLALDGITSFSRRPLALATYMGFGLLVLSAALVIWAMVSYFLGDTERGWASLMAVIGILFSLQFFVLGIIGEYVGRLFEANQRRPLFLIASNTGMGLGRTRDHSKSETVE